MKLHSKYTTLLSLMFVIVLSCTLTSKFGLPNTQKIDRELLGTWTTPCIVNQESDTLTISTYNEYQYQLLFDTKEKMNAYSYSIKQYQIINILSNINQQNMFYGYEVEKDTLRFFEVNPELLQKDVHSTSQLVDFFHQNIDKPNFFMNACVMVKHSLK